jgi:Uri superfamily endonuclease
MNLAAICASESALMRGTYTVILECKGPVRIRFGRLGHANLLAGYYLYTGSALGRGAVSLEGRLARHKRRSKRLKWHVDYLTSHSKCRFKRAVCLVSSSRLECKINNSLSTKLKVQPILARLGSTDCGCNAHLVRVTRRFSLTNLLTQLGIIYSEFGNPLFV